MQGKRYSEMGCAEVVQDTLSFSIADGKIQPMYFKNKVRVEMYLSAGGFVCDISTPITEDDLKRITDTLRHVCEQLGGSGIVD